MLAASNTRSIAHIARTLAAQPHVAGSAVQAQTRDFVLKLAQGWGLKTDVATYNVYLPYPTGVTLELVAPEQKTFQLVEPAIAEIVETTKAIPFPGQHGFGAAGDVTAELVFVNYGTADDFAALKTVGVDPAGKIVLARYGKCYRGIKVANAQAAGAAGCLLYSDPADDGYARGEVYPQGPLRPPVGVQHGSVKVGPPGDPTTPGVPSVADAQRIDPADSPDLPRVPSAAISAQVAGDLLRALSGPKGPDGWVGGLPVGYEIGPGPAEVHLRVTHDDQRRDIWDTFARIEGAEYPDEWIILGGHRDAWCNGAADNVSGSTCVMEAARIVAEAFKESGPPKRTIIFATWDAEEWGIMGSAEWVEEHRDELRDKVALYINLDMIVTGPDFSASASPSIKTALIEAAASVPHPDLPGKMIADIWTDEPVVGTPGGGSDHTGFLMHCGLPVATWGFHGLHGIYHSLYDTSAWMERYGDPGYKRHRAVAQLGAVLATRFANADVLPNDYARYARELHTAVSLLRSDRTARDRANPDDGRARAEALRAFTQAAESFEERLKAADLTTLSNDTKQRINELLRGVEPTLTWQGPVGGLTKPGFDPHKDKYRWERNLVFGVAPDSGYAKRSLPGIYEALDHGSDEALHAEMMALTTQLDLAAKRLEAAERLLDGARVTEKREGD
ncbi:MAG: M28 family peptidase [Phycisphaerales bacterium]|nr:M28 family peptidase [Phycisphaerales bacterium]